MLGKILLSSGLGTFIALSFWIIGYANISKPPIASIIGQTAVIFIAIFSSIFLKEKIKPVIGSAGVSAVPMAARISHHIGQEEDPNNFLLAHAMGPNVAGVIGSAVIAGLFLSLLN